MDCPAYVFLPQRKDDCECQHGAFMCWKNNHRHSPNSTETKPKTSPNICLLYISGRVVILCRMCLALERPQPLMGGHHLNVLSQLGADEDNLISEATAFIAACYGCKVEGDMNTQRYQLWKSKMANSKITSAPKLKSLPPTHGTFVQHAHRAQHQVINEYGNRPLSQTLQTWTTSSMDGRKANMVPR